MKMSFRRGISCGHWLSGCLIVWCAAITCGAQAPTITEGGTNPVRLFWGATGYVDTTNSLPLQPAPEWFAGAWKDGGAWSNEAWQANAGGTNASLCIALDKAALPPETGLLADFYFQGEFFIQLLDADRNPLLSVMNMHPNAGKLWPVNWRRLTVSAADTVRLAYLRIDPAAGENAMYHTLMQLASVEGASRISGDDEAADARTMATIQSGGSAGKESKSDAAGKTTNPATESTLKIHILQPPHGIFVF